MPNNCLLDWENYNEVESKIGYVPSVLSISIFIMARQIPNSVNCQNCLDVNGVRSAR